MLPLSPIQLLESELYTEKKLQIWVKRDELIHPLISGNKWRKLQYNLEAFKQLGKKHLLSFGGAFSNHLLALAAAAQKYQIKATLIVRGDGYDEHNPTLRLAREMGLNLVFIDRANYKKREDPAFQQQLMDQYQADFLLPEGGTNAWALKGCRTIVDEITFQLSAEPDFICVAAGTGGTSAGILEQTKQTKQTKVLVFPALKGDFMEKAIRNISTTKLPAFQCFSQYHFGGYAKFKPELIQFINQFHQAHNILLDPVYTGKMFFGLEDLIQQDYFPEGSSIVAIHTGGLQGNLGFNYRFGNLIPSPEL